MLTDVGDDAAVVSCKGLDDICVTTDTLVAGTHFLESAPAASIGYKSLAVNLSDLAAMGAVPKWYSMTLTLPEYDELWISEFCESVYGLADKYNIRLIGGDLTKGPLSITISAIGTKYKKYLNRSGAEVGHGVFVTGQLGVSGLLLDTILDSENISMYKKNIIEIYGHNLNTRDNKLYYPVPRVNVGMAIADIASSSIDISDGLLADLGHIVSMSNVSADILIDKLPISVNIYKVFNVNSYDKLTDEQKKLVSNYVLTAGDEYELIFTADLHNIDKLKRISEQIGVKITHIGNIISSDNDSNNSDKLNKISVLDKNNIDISSEYSKSGWQHFRG